MAEKGQAASVNTLARQIVRSRHAQNRLERTKCSLSAVNLNLSTAIASMTTGTSLKMSTGMMKEMNRLVKAPEMAKIMHEMQQEMMKAEIADELMEETFEQSDDEQEVDKEVRQVFDDLALDVSQFMAVAEPAPGVAAAAPAAKAPAPVAVSVDDDPLLQRLQALQK